MSKVWTELEVEKLIEIYQHKKNSELCIIFNKNKDQVRYKAKSLQLKKSDTIKNEIKIDIIKKSGNRYLTINDISKIAKIYNTRSEFQKGDSSAYIKANKLGIIDDVCSHMIVKNYSTPQLIIKQILEGILEMKCMYNTRKIIKPYEIDIYFPVYKLAIEYDGERWHRNDKIDKYKLCSKINIKLITIKENSRRYEEDIKKQLCENIEVLSKISNKFTIESINNYIINTKQLVPNLEFFKMKCLEYGNFIDFRKNENYIYSILKANKLINVYTSHMNKKINYDSYTNEIFSEIINRYSNLMDFIKNENGVYQHLLRNNKVYLYEFLKKDVIIWNEEEIVNEISKYEYYIDFMKKSSSCYNIVISKKLQHLTNNLIRTKNKYSNSDIEDVLSKYDILKDFIKNDNKVYNYLYKNNLEYMYSHMTKRKKWSVDELINVISECKSISELKCKSIDVYHVARKRHKHLLNGLTRIKNQSKINI